LVKCTDHERKMYPDMSNQSTHLQNVSKKSKIFDTSLRLTKAISGERDG
jgi:hypothetical protein